MSARQELEALSPAKRDLFQKLLAEKNQGRAARSAQGGRIPLRPAGVGALPLSFAQQRLWFLDQLAPGNPAYNMSIPIRLLGALDPRRLVAALGEVVRRHEVLRTTFGEAAGRPVQVVHDEAAVVWRRADLQAVGPACRAGEVARLLKDEARHPFALERGPLVRGLLLRLGAAEHVLVLTIHHIVFDGWSIALLMREVASFYRSRATGAPVRLPPLAIQYGDFALWQRTWLEGGELAQQLAYWRQQLAAADEALALPTDRPRPPVQTFAGKFCSAVIRPDLARSLSTLAREEGATLFVVLLAAFQALLARWTGSRAISVGTPVNNRNRVEVEDVIGFFVNTLILRTDVSLDLDFRALVGRVREVALGAFGHQDVPFERLVEDLQPARDLSRSPLFQVQFAFRNTPKADLSLPGLAIELLVVDPGVTQFDLTLSMSENGDELPIDLFYNVDLFDRTTAQRLLGHFQHLLAEAVASREMLAVFSRLGLAERQQVLVEWNDTAMRRDVPATLRDLVGGQIARTPDAVAVVFRGESLSYRELARRTGRLARHLRALGVESEALVGVAMERSLELVVALLGILKAGAAYVPFDPGYPADRLAFMMADAGVAVVLTQAQLAADLPVRSARLVALDTGWPDIGRQAVDDAVVPCTEDQLAYVLYTSGSTGRPKGAMNTHRAIANRILWMQEAFRLEPEDRVLQKTPVSFDVSVWEFFWPLMTGACLVMAEPGGHLDPAYLVDVIAEREVTTLHFVPSMLAAFLVRDDLVRCSSLARVMASGEALPAELARRFAGRLGARLYNLYGPTEAAIDVTAWPCGEAGEGESVPIGRPIANLRTLLLDTAGALASLRQPGELAIGGVGLARGYWRRPDLTAERFVPDPCALEPGARLYRTGDLARCRPGGEIEFLGRLDTQVKIRGVRIELGEIEAVLGRHPGIAEAAVVARRDERGEMYLVAYVVPQPGEAPQRAAWREHLRGELPEHMVPTVFVELPAMPLSPSGKLDRRALPVPDRVTAATAPLGAPSALEAAIAGIWRRALGREEVGVEDNFFDLGGHSLRLAEVQALLRRDLVVELSVVELFQYPTIRSLARFIQGREKAAPVAPVAGSVTAAPSGRIAVVAMTGRFPGAANVEELWRLLREGREGIVSFSRQELLAAGEPAALVDQPSYVPAWGALGDIDLFAAQFFGFSPREAEVLDPQQRLFLECAWEALERAGHAPDQFTGRIGVYAGAGMSSYALHNLGFAGGLLDAVGGFQALLGNDKDYLATRTSYCLNLRGPSVSVQTACSTSLVAVSLACQALLDGRCDMALAGGVSIRSRQQAGYVYSPGHIFSADGHCRAFDAEAAGTVGGSGVGLVVLRRLEDALADGDLVHAVILGSAINNDGALKAGYTAPSVTGQAEVIAAAHAAAGIDPATIGYVEAHGTATVLGDPIEIAGLTQAFRRGGATPPPGSCAIGSVKTNLGHLDAAAGVTGLIKTVLALEHREIPPSLHFTTANPKIGLAESPFYVNSRLAAWEESGGCRRAGVSSFGIGGTNAHVVVEEAPAAPTTDPGRPQSLLVFSARTAEAVAQAAANLGSFLADGGDVALADVAFTLETGRQAFEHRAAVVAHSVADAAAVLGGADPRRLHRGVAQVAERGVAFLFPGQGSQHAGMAEELYRTEAVFRTEVDCCADLLASQPVGPAGERGLDLRRVLFGDLRDEIGETAFAQPALFAVEYALARLWIGWGVRPQAMLGHSVGEYVAACLAGVLSLADALKLVAVRGRLMQAAPRGAMLSVRLPEEALRARLRDTEGALAIAAVNGPSLAVVAGPEEAVAAFSRALAAGGVDCRRLHTSHAFHTAMMEGALAPFAATVATVSLRPPEVPFLSNRTGTWITAAEATDPAYWVEHLRRPVLFAAGLGEVLRDADCALLEVGPGRALSTLARGRSDAGDRPIVRSLRHPDEQRGDLETVLEAAGRLWIAGVKLDWRGFHGGERRRRVELPTYPFERQRYWLTPAARPVAVSAIAATSATSAAADSVELAVTSWQEAPAGLADLVGSGCLLLGAPRSSGPTFAAHFAASEATAEALRRLGELLSSRPAGRVVLTVLPLEGDAVGERTDPGGLYARPALATAFAAPRSDVERQVAGLWQDLLGIREVGIFDDFFELGGHSLLATRLLSRVRDHYGVEPALDAIFQAPVLADFCQAIEALRAATSAPAAPSLVRVARGAGARLPLSFAQQRMWFLHQLDPESAAYNMPIAVRLAGRLEPSLLARILDEIVARHEVLRTAFREEDGEAYQVVAPPGPRPLPVVDLRALPAASRERTTLRLAMAAAVRPWDLAAGHLLRSLLLDLGTDERVLSLNLHHIVTDGWSMGILVRELGELYGAFSAGRPSPLAELPIQYGDYASWQRQWLDGEVLDAQLRFWREQIGSDPEPLELPTDRPRDRSRGASARGGIRQRGLGLELSSALQGLSRQTGATVFMVLFAAFAAILQRIGGQRSFRVGTPVANRNRSEVEGLIGFFVNTLVLAADVDPAATVGALLDRVREVSLAAQAHREVPFERVVEALQTRRDLGHTPLFQVFFALQNAPAARLELPGLTLTALAAETVSAKFEWSLIVEERRQGLWVSLEYAAELFDATTVERALDQFHRLLAAFPDSAEQRLDTVSGLAPAELQQVVREWNDTAVSHLEGATIAALWTAQAAATPSAPALSHHGVTRTYGELAARSAELARRLRALGVGPDHRVGICARRSIEMVVGLLAVLEAGGAYVPLDPAYPPDRLAYMLEDSRVAVLLAEAALASRLPAHAAAVVLLDAPAPAQFAASAVSAPVGLDPDHLAYVIYTSGSTGRPKGVEIRHGAVVNFFAAMDRQVGCRPGDRMLAATSINFDISVLELLWSLVRGALVVLLDDQAMSSPDLPAGPTGPEDSPVDFSLPAEAVRHGATLFQCTPSMMRVVAALPGGWTALRSLRAVLLGGEALPPVLAAEVRQNLSARLFNLYGPTETTVWSTCQEIRGAAIPAPGASLGIGRPLVNTEVHLFDGQGLPVPAGVPGALHIGGAGLARGYLGRPDLTAERFVPHPFPATGGERLYNTGDLARRQPDGALEYLGRIDHQVKVRGYRVELGEIESILDAHPGVRESVVAVRIAASGEPSLAAYFVAAATTPEGPEHDSLRDQLRDQLRGRLPAYMVPTAFVALPALPRTPSGKVDRRALPNPGRPAAGETTFAAPGNDVEVRLAGIWCRVLRLERVGVDEDFFAVGGHSITAVQVLSRVRSAFGVELRLRSLFETPTIAGLAGAVLSARAANAATSANFATGATVAKIGSAIAPRLSTAPATDAPLSFAQRRLWLLDRLEPGSVAYSMPTVLRLIGNVEVALLAAALTEIVRRHEVLRTTFPLVGSEPVQRVGPPAAVDLARIDLSALDRPRRETQAADLVRRAIARPFDLECGPLVRAFLVRLDAGEHHALFNMHHIASDGWSVGLFVRELVELYQAGLAQRPPRLATLPIQYRDFAVWQAEQLAGDGLTAQLAYWREHLTGAPELLDLPTDRPRSAPRSDRSGTCWLEVPPAEVPPLRDLGLRAGATLFAVVLAGFQEVLRRYSGQDDFVVGTPLHGRDRLETEDLIGFFVNTLPVRARFSSLRSFLDLVLAAQQEVLAASAHQDLPFERLVEELVPRRDLQASPVFQVVFTLQNAPRGELRLPGLELAPLRFASPGAKFDLVVSLWEHGSGLAGEVVYASDLFDRTTIERLTGHFRSLLVAAGNEPKGELAALALLAGAERQVLVSEWSGRAVPLPASPTVAALFAGQAQRAPHAVALVGGEESVSYGELARRATGIARRLRARGLGPESKVGVCLDRSPSTIAVLLGILEAGGAYVPLDPGYPSERLRFMAEDAGLCLLITQREVAAALPEVATVPVEDLAAAPADGGDLVGPPSVHGDNLAYVMYTSGSTGRPKGVAVTQRNVVRLVCGNDFADLGGQQVFLQLAPISFDASTLEIWAPLANGGCLVVAPPGELSLGQVGRLLARHGVTTLWLTAGLFHLMVDERLEDLAQLSQLLAGGDALSPRHVRRVLRELPGTALVNGYGPTENTTFSCCRRLAPTVAAGDSVPIGRPIVNSRAYVLDDALRPVPVGVAGELTVAGSGLARGYLGRPDLTAERFVPDPVSGLPGERLYRTGDRARWLAGGDLEFLGRRDLQVKVRGFRIEPGEIEAALAEHPEVRAAAVAVHGDGQGGKRLAAYAVLRSAGTAPPADWRRFLAAKLPAYMLPADLMILPRLPLNANGKVDRGALPAPAGPVSAASAARELGGALRNPVEELLGALWCEVLGVPAVAADDDFFALGGHSLLAAQVVSRLNAACGVEIALRDLFENPVLAALAGKVTAALGSGARAPEAALPLVPVARDVPLPLSFAQERLWFLDQLEPGRAAYNIPLAFRLDGPLRVEVLAAACGEIVRRHDSLRTVFAVSQGQPVQRLRALSGTLLPVVDLAALPAAAQPKEARRVTEEEVARPFDLAAGPLVRLRLLRWASGDHLLVGTLHHAIADGWSLGVLTRELVALYRAGSAGIPSPLPDLSIQYADFAVWQRRRLSTEVAASLLDFWRRLLAGGPPVLELPTDRPRPGVPSGSGAHLPVALPETLAAEVVALGRREGASLFMVLLAAFAALLSRSAGQARVNVGAPVAGRTRVELEGLIGLFVNTLVLPVDLAGGPTFRELVAAARRTVLAAHAHQDLPFEKLVEALEPERDLGRSPLFQVLLVLQNTPQAVFELPDLRLSPLRLDTGTAKLDLTLGLAETGGGLRGSFEYSRELFDRTTIARLAGQLATFLAATVGDPGRPVAALPTLSAAEVSQLKIEWNDTDLRLPPAAPLLCELFAARARAAPDAVALVAGDEELTYGALDRWSEGIAGRLRERGVGPEVRVGVFLPRSPVLVAALLGILKAGGAYLPLDTTSPTERLAGVLAEARPALLLSAASLAGRLPATAAEVLFPDPSWRPLRPSGPPIALRPQPLESLAYVLYTSGSTGRPKGVAITHRSAATLMHWARTVFSAAELGGVLAGTSVCFDLSVFELFVPLSWGGTVVLGEDSLALDGLRGAERVTLVNTVPSALAQLLELAAVPRSVCTVNLAGELLHGALVRAIYRQTAASRVWNLYGPTEDTTYSTGLGLARDAAGEPAIGRPLGDSRAYVVDVDLQPVPIGVAGELLLGGAGLARGYLHRPDLTARSFVPDPFSAVPGERLYRTGDLARRRSDGLLDFLGRRDDQVKLRGFRIELEEVEAALLAVPAVQDAAVVAHEGRLFAFYRPLTPSASPLAGELKDVLAARLPAYMVPAFFIALAALPVNRNGKVDRRALRAHAGGVGLPTAGRRLPSTPLEELLAGIWCEVLRLPAVGADDSFFALGGHSLLATQVSARVRRDLGIDLPVRQLFEAPSLAALALAVERGRGHRPAGPLGAIGEVPRARRAGGLPLSFGQQRLWFLHSLQPASPAYNVPFVLALHGCLDGGALRRALTTVVRRHEVLRTRYVATAGELVQIAAEPAEVPLPLLDLGGLGGLGATAQAAHAAERVRAECLRPFDLERGPVLRALLIRLAADEHRLVVTLHHIAGDRESLRIFQRELAVVYRAAVADGADDAVAGEASTLAPLAVQYADFACWQRARLTAEVRAQEASWWRERLRELPPELPVPTDRPRPPMHRQRGSQVALALPATLVAALARLGRARGATPFMTFLAAFESLLSRHAGERDFAVGTPVTGRNRVEVEGLIGFFVNTLVLRAGVAAAEPFDSLLARVREDLLAAHAHQDLPFESLVEELQPERNTSRGPLFQVAFTLDSFAGVAPTLPGLTVQPLVLPTATSKFDLTLAVALAGEGDGGEASLEYDSDLFDRTTARRLLAGYGVLLAALANDPSAALEDVELLAAAERQQVLVEWSCGLDPDGEPTPVHILVERRAAECPHAPAIVAGETRWTYGELDRAAERLADRLTELGVGPEGLVGLFLGRGAETVIAALAALKAGGAYLPIDPAYPAERIRWVVADSAARVVVSRRDLAAQLPPLAVPLVLIDADPPPPPALRRDTRGAVLPGHLAYVIYTSGSTGRPKGVEIVHSGLSRLVAWHLRRYSLTAADRTTQIAGPAFDAAVWEIWPCLAVGASLHVPSDEVRSSPAELVGYLAALGITVAFVPTPLAQAALGENWPAALALRALLTGGEALERRPPPDLPFEVVNHYGPTEATVVATADPVAADGDGLPAIGRPIDGVRAYVLDAASRPLPAAASGEILLGGAGLARGYRRQPGATAERFRPDPWSGEPGGRLYCTGDLAAYSPRGELRFLGRIDTQVKLRGFRIELAEIEAALLAVAGVRQAAVVLRREDGDPKLVGYVAPKVPGGLTPDALRQALRGELPPYMVPADILVLPDLPLTPNGKIDRPALPSPAAETSALRDRGAVPPRDPVELALAGVWSEVLARPAVGVEDSFFDLGGHSLLAVRLLAEIRRTVGRELLLADLFRAPTVALQASLLRGAAPPSALRSLVPLVTRGTATPFFCIHPVGGTVFCYWDLAHVLGRPFFGLQRTASSGLPPTATVADLAASYLAEIRQVQPHGPYLLGGWSMGALVAYEMACRLGADEVAVVALVDPPDLGSLAGLAGREADEEALVEWFRRDLAGLGAGNEAVCQADAALYPMFRANLEAMRSFQPGPFAGRLEIFLAAEGRATPDADDARGWAALCSRAGVHRVQGGHYDLLRQPAVHLWTADLRAAIEEALSDLCG